MEEDITAELREIIMQAQKGKKDITVFTKAGHVFTGTVMDISKTILHLQHTIPDEFTTASRVDNSFCALRTIENVTVHK